MSHLNTSCERCYFASPVDKEKSCEFFIPDVLKDKKQLEEVNGFYYIHNYRCKYGVSKESAEGPLKQFDVDLKEYAKNQVIPKYELYLKINSGENFEKICENIKKLAIAPQSIHLVFDYDFDVTNVQPTADRVFKNATFRWKLHRFLEEKPDYEQLYVCLSTDQYVAKSDFIWILNDTILETCIINDSINRINFIINVEQPDLGILNYRLSENHFYGIFMTLDNLDGIWQHEGHDIDQTIKSLYIDNVGFYD